MTSVHADIEALEEFHETLVRYRHAQRELAAQGSDAIRVARASLEARASRWQAQAELCQAEFEACRDRAAQGGSEEGTVDCSGYARAVEQSLERLEHIRRWQQRIDQEASEFTGVAGRFVDLLENDLPRTEEQLLDAVRSLEAARRVQAPGAPGAPGALGA